jgi:hypothetical protein
MNPTRSIVIAVLLPVLLAGLPASAADGKTYTPGHFDGIEVSGSAIIRFVQGAEDSVFIEGASDAQDAVQPQVHNGTLVIEPAGSWKFWNGQRPRVTITARELARVSISGAADFVAESPVNVGRLVVNISGSGLARFDQLKADQLSFRVAGSGDGQMAGTAREVEIKISGRSEFRGEKLMVERAKVAISGLGDAKLWVTKELNISVAGVGSVDYWGSPVVKRSVSGHATINDRGAKPAN